MKLHPFNKATRKRNSEAVLLEQNRHKFRHLSQYLYPNVTVRYLPYIVRRPRALGVSTNIGSIAVSSQINCASILALVYKIPKKSAICFPILYINMLLL